MATYPTFETYRNNTPGVDIPTVARISGHRTLAMVAKYAHANGEHIQAATDKLERRYQHTA